MEDDEPRSLGSLRYDTCWQRCAWISSGNIKKVHIFGYQISDYECGLKNNSWKFFIFHIFDNIHQQNYHSGQKLVFK